MKADMSTRIEKTAVTIWVAATAGSLAFAGLMAWVAIHFIRKYW